MRGAGFRAVLAEELAFSLKRPMLWTLAGAAVLLAWGMSTGHVGLGTGTATVGGMKAWITSEFSNAFIFAVITASFYSFFVSIAAAGAVVRDEEAGVAEILRATPLSPAAWVGGKAAALALAFSLVLALHLAASACFNHLLPNPEAELIQGPFELANYLRPALLFALPTLVFFGGLGFYFGVRWRRPALAFLVPLAVLTACFSLLWNWSPPGLSPAVERLLQLLDPAGFRWLNETWLKLDQGAEFYNTARVGFDGTGAANRLLALGIGLAGVCGAWRLVARQRSSPRRASAGARGGRRGALPASPRLAAEGLPAMAQAAPSFPRAALASVRSELGALLRHPGIYLFAVFILSQSMAVNLLDRGPFQTAVLLTSGQAAVGTFNTLSLLVSLLVMLFFVESLEREETAGLAPLVHSAPAGTGALLAGKVLGISGVALLVLLASYLGGAVAMLVQGRVLPTPTPYLLVWGLLLFPTFVAWAAFLAAVHALTASRYLTYGAGLGILAFTLYRAFTERMSWAGNWLLWDALSWSDIAPLTADRRALLLNRLALLALGALLFALAVALRRRRRPDLTQLLGRLRPKPLLALGARAAPLAIPLLLLPLLLGLALWLEVLGGFGGAQAKEEARRYWQQNLATWKDAPQPALTRVEVDLRLEPGEGAFSSRGSFQLANSHAEPLERFAVTGGRHWRQISWTLDGRPWEPEDRSGLFVFTPEEPLAPGAVVTLGFSFSGRYPDGVSANGGELPEFILPEAVVLTSFRPSFVPVIGYDAERGVDDENRFDPPDYPRDLHRQVLPPAAGSPTLFPVRLRVDAPEDFLVNGVGVLAEETVAGGRRVRVWESDSPVPFFNAVGGRWQVRRGKGTAIYYHPEHAFNVEEMSRALEAARRHYSQWFAPFPWQELKLSEFPNLATYAQGFATNITFSEGIGFLTRADEETDAVFMVTAHEAAHQWWGNLLRPGDGPGGAILSEGMAHFSTLLLVEEVEGEKARMALARRFEEQYTDHRRKDAERPLVRTDSTQPGDRTVIYDKGAWAFWMLDRAMGREALLAGLQSFLQAWQAGPDYPLLEDLLEHLRPFAPDPEAFDRLAEEWFFTVVLPEYRLGEPRLDAAGTGWRVRVRLENRGSGRMPVDLAAVAGERFGAGEDPYQEARTTLLLGPGEAQEVTLEIGFEPERLVVDPDVEVLQLRRKRAEVEL